MACWNRVWRSDAIEAEDPSQRGMLPNLEVLQALLYEYRRFENKSREAWSYTTPLSRSTASPWRPRSRALCKKFLRDVRSSFSKKCMSSSALR